MIAITGATGNIGRKIAAELLSRGQRVRCIARGADKLNELAVKGAEVATVALQDTDALTRAFQGARAVFAMIPPNYGVPNFRAYQNGVGESIARAIENASVRFVVNLSSQGAHLADMTGPIKGLHDQEERLHKLMGAHILHLRPAYFMENLLAFIPMIRGQNIMGSALQPDLPIPMIATWDIAAFAAEKLTTTDFSGIVIQDLLGQRNLSMNAAARIIGRKIGKPDLSYVQFSYEDTRKALVGMGLGDDLAGLYIEMIRAFNDDLFHTVRTPENTTKTPFEEFAETFAKIYSAS